MVDASPVACAIHAMSALNKVLDKGEEKVNNHMERREDVAAPHAAPRGVSGQVLGG